MIPVTVSGGGSTKHVQGYCLSWGDSSGRPPHLMFLDNTTITTDTLTSFTVKSSGGTNWLADSIITFAGVKRS